MGLVHYYSRPPSRALLMRGERPPWIANSKCAKYLAQIVLSAPPWLGLDDHAEMRMLHAWACARTAFTGERYVLDHVIPVNHPAVCGLTVPWNFEVVHWLVNLHKGNKWNPDQLDLFA